MNQDERAQARLCLSHLGFRCMSITDDKGDGEFMELWANGDSDTVGISWRPVPVTSPGPPQPAPAPASASAGGSGQSVAASLLQVSTSQPDVGVWRHLDGTPCKVLAHVTPWLPGDSKGPLPCGELGDKWERLQVTLVMVSTMPVHSFTCRGCGRPFHNDGSLFLSMTSKGCTTAYAATGETPVPAYCTVVDEQFRH